MHSTITLLTKDSSLLFVLRVLLYPWRNDFSSSLEQFTMLSPLAGSLKYSSPNPEKYYVSLISTLLVKTFNLLILLYLD